MPSEHGKFIAASTFEAIYYTQNSSQKLLLESRIRPNGSMTIFTTVGDSQIRVNSLKELISVLPECAMLSIPHSVRVLWNGTFKTGVLTEILTLIDGVSSDLGVKLILNIDDQIYETEDCETLTEAMMDLNGVIGPDTECWFQICFDCNYSRPDLSGPGGNDRDFLQCYRDEPEAFDEVKARGKFANSNALHAGDHFVSAFHTCAAWQHYVLPSQEKNADS